jgi:HEAT repeat protein
MKKLVIVCWAVLFAGCSPEPTWEGKRASLWREDLKDPTGPVRWRAAYALGKIGPRAKAAIPEITRLLKDPDPIVRFVAAESLAEFGPDAKSAVPALREAARDGYRPVREVARAAIKHIDPQAAVEEEN